MRKLVLATLLCLAAWCGPAAAQSSIVGSGIFGDAKTLTVAAYQGPGDIVTGASAWGSCARVYNAAGASTATSLCDLVAVTGGAAVCTLRGTSTGFVDLAASYCAGTTPSAACTAASGGSCKVTKIYDQSGSGNHWTQATLASMPGLTFSALNGLPGINCSGGTNALLVTAGNVTASQPFTFSIVAKATNSTGGGVIGGAGGTDADVAFGNAVLGMGVAASLTFSGAATANVFHAGQGLSAAGVGASVINIDNTETTGTLTSVIGASALRVCRNGSGGASLVGIMMEIGLWATTGFSGTQRTNVNANEHGTNGYNF